MTLPSGSGSHVYFIRPLCGGPVKIGCSAHPETRLPTYAHWSPVPLEIVAACPGGRGTEAMLHKRFASARLHHEWFSAVPELLDLIEHVKRHGAIPGAQHHLDLSQFRNAWREWTGDTGRVMKRLGISRREIAERAGVRTSNVAGWLGYPSERCAGIIAEIAAERGIQITARDFFEPVEPAPPKKRRARKPRAEAST